MAACNELSAYSGDDYARTHGVAALRTRSSMAWEKSARSIAPPVRTPNIYRCSIWSACRLAHHTLGSGQFDFFCGMVEPMVCSHFMGTRVLEGPSELHRHLRGNLMNVSAQSSTRNGEVRVNAPVGSSEVACGNRELREVEGQQVGDIGIRCKQIRCRNSARTDPCGGDG